MLFPFFGCVLQDNQSGGVRLGQRWEVIFPPFVMSSFYLQLFIRFHLHINACGALLSSTSWPAIWLYLNYLYVMHFMSRFCSHDFIGEFTTSYKELCRGQSQLNVYEVSGDKDGR